MRRVISRPATCITTHEDGQDVYICLEAWLSDEHEVPTTVELHDLESARLIDVVDITVDYPGMLQGTTSPSGYGITVRAVEDDDCVGMPGLPSFPCPATVVGALLTGETVDTHIEALTEDDGFVTTLMLVTDVGLWLRYSAAWIKLNDVSLIDGVNTVDVAEGAVDLYDAADRAGQQLPVSSLPGPSKNMIGPFYTELTVAGDTPRTFTEPMTASTIPLTIDTVRDLPAAVEAAQADPSMRWYVERRAKALDPEYKMPWAEVEEPEQYIRFDTSSDGTTIGSIAEKRDEK